MPDRARWWWVCRLCDPRMIAFSIKLLLCYLLGSIVGSLLLGRLRGVDIRALGSGNAGATNALRTQGKLFALATALIDVGKGIVAVLVIAPWTWFSSNALGLIETQLACGLAAALGHCYPLFHGLRGGKGAGTLFGAVLVLFPMAALVMFGVWLLVLLSSGYVGLSTVLAGATFPLALLVLYGPTSTVVLTLALAAAALMAYTHRGNLQRLARGTEHRFERARVFARWLQRN